MLDEQVKQVVPVSGFGLLLLLLLFWCVALHLKSLIIIIIIIATLFQEYNIFGYTTLLPWRGRNDLSRLKTSTCYHHTFIHQWTTLVHATLRVSDVVDKCSSWFADLTFDWRHVMVTAVERSYQTHRIITFLHRLFARFKSNFHK